VEYSAKLVLLELTSMIIHMVNVLNV